MNITKEEKLMYKAMKAIYDSQIPISFKGSMVLKACLYEAGYADDTRHTLDIDGNWNSDDYPATEQIAESLQHALDNAGIALKVVVYRTYREGRSAGFELRDLQTEEILFTMDIDVNRPAPTTRIYEMSGMQFRGVVPAQMLADKISVVSSDKVFRRIKDVVDLYYLSKVLVVDTKEVINTLNNSNRNLGNFEGFLNKTDDLKHSYEKFRFVGDVGKPPFEEVYEGAKSVIAKLRKSQNKQNPTG